MNPRRAADDVQRVYGMVATDPYRFMSEPEDVQ